MLSNVYARVQQLVLVRNIVIAAKPPRQTRTQQCKAHAQQCHGTLYGVL
jgi:hypothetical protein